MRGKVQCNIGTQNAKQVDYDIIDIKIFWFDVYYGYVAFVFWPWDTLSLMDMCI